MGDRVEVSTEIHAPASRVWALVADLPRMAEWSPENDGVTWRGGATAAVPGASFGGTNHNGGKSWRTSGTVLQAVPGEVLSFRVRAAGLKVSVWTYRFEETADGCRVTESWVDERGRLVKALGRPVSGVGDRAVHNRSGMETTLANLKAAAEA
jgi:uncharacterized protein YndB with AHSA1/START domain